jgi:hypothetical protein
MVEGVPHRRSSSEYGLVLGVIVKVTRTTPARHTHKPRGVGVVRGRGLTEGCRCPTWAFVEPEAASGPRRPSAP